MAKHDNLIFTVEECAGDGVTVIEELARTGNLEIAQAAYLTAIRIRPKSVIVLRRQALIMRMKKP
ncbi:MAG: hypothetical protein ACTSYE_00950 [Alphaproteobacteria bacterium]